MCSNTLTSVVFSALRTWDAQRTLEKCLGRVAHRSAETKHTADSVDLRPARAEVA